MWHLSLLLSKLFDLFLTPFESLPPFWSLFIFSISTGILMLLIFRYTSNQKGIKETKNRIKAHLMEIRLFKDDLRILLSAQKNLLIYNAKYMKYAVKPMLFMIVPVSIILIQLHCWFGYSPLKVGESTLLKVKVDEWKKVLSGISIEVDEGIIVETPPLMISEKREVCWRIRANMLGEHKILVKALPYSFQKKVLVSNEKLGRISPRRVKSNLWDNLVSPGEKPIIENSLVNRIEVDYPERSIEILGLRTHWLIIFFVLSIVFGFILKGFFRVEL
jgi:uncharacterized membrane protein (DUF106 family)